jgi:hypothetical protein
MAAKKPAAKPKAPAAPKKAPPAAPPASAAPAAPASGPPPSGASAGPAARAPREKDAAWYKAQLAKAKAETRKLKKSAAVAGPGKPSTPDGLTMRVATPPVKREKKGPQAKLRQESNPTRTSRLRLW